MRTASLLALPLLSVLAVACGGQVGASNGDHDIQDPNVHDPKTKLPADTTKGSFDLTFTNVTSTPTFSGGNPQVTPPVRGANARFDLLDGQPAYVTPRWGTPATLLPTLTATSLALAMKDDDYNGITFSGDSGGYNTTDRISSITFGVTASGGYDGTFTATGTEETFSGDVGYEANLTITGTISADKTLPETKIDAIPSYGLLPWQPVTLHYAEPPVFAEGASSSNVVHISPGGSIEGIVIDGSSASLTATAILGGWEIPSATLTVDPLYDPSNNASTTITSPVKYLGIGSPQTSFGFDAASSVNEYGTSTTLFSYLSDSTCESGGCLEVGVIDRTQCDTPDSGFAGILKTPTTNAGTLHVRYRILAGVDTDTSGPGATVVPESAAFTLETATPGVLPQSQPVGFAVADLQTIPSTLGMTHATAWKTIDVPVPANASQEAGFAIKIGNTSCGGGPFWDPNRLVVLVDSVTVD